MGHKFAEIAFTPSVQRVQERMGSRRSYLRLEQGDAHHDVLGPNEAAFIAERDSFYMATVGETGWPYIQHRGGPPGFIRVLDEKTIGFADFRGNRQYVSVGNLDIAKQEILETSREYVAAIKNVCESIDLPDDNNVRQPWPSHVYFEDINAQSQFDMVEIIVQMVRDNGVLNDRI